jgi:hypothetical protein
MLLRVPLIGCATHRLNIVVQREMLQYSEELDSFQSLMFKLRILTQSTKLRYVHRLWFETNSYLLDCCMLYESLMLRKAPVALRHADCRFSGDFVGVPTAVFGNEGVGVEVFAAL